MDLYSKGVLTVIAIATSAIAFKLYSPSVHSSSPTLGDYMALKDITDFEARQKEVLKLTKSLPMVRVQGGDMKITGSVEIEP